MTIGVNNSENFELRIKIVLIRKRAVFHQDDVRFARCHQDVLFAPEVR